MHKDTILAHFETNDPVILPYLQKLEPFPLLEKGDASKFFFQLCREIVGQQLSSKAASAIFKRFEALFPNGITPEAVIALSHEELRASGISNAKARYVRNIAEAVVAGLLPFEDFHEMKDMLVIQHLTKVKGIGHWTSEMFLMFTLGRADVFSFGDLGLQKGFKKLYNFKKEPTRKQIEKVVKKWSPYRTYGCLALWSVVDG